MVRAASWRPRRGGARPAARAGASTHYRLPKQHPSLALWQRSANTRLAAPPPHLFEAHCALQARGGHHPQRLLKAVHLDVQHGLAAQRILVLRRSFEDCAQWQGRPRSGWGAGAASSSSDGRGCYALSSTVFRAFLGWFPRSWVSSLPNRLFTAVSSAMVPGEGHLTPVQPRVIAVYDRMVRSHEGLSGLLQWGGRSTPHELLKEALFGCTTPRLHIQPIEQSHGCQGGSGKAPIAQLQISLIYSTPCSSP